MGWPNTNIHPSLLLRALSEYPAALSPRIVKEDVPNSTNVMAALDDLKCDVQASKLYHFNLGLRIVDSGLEGVSIDFDGGTATAATFWASAMGGGLELSISKHSSALNTPLSGDSIDGGYGLVLIQCFLEVDDAGTFIPRFAQVAHSSGSITVKKGSWISPPLEVIT